MHETHLLDNIFKYFGEQEKLYSTSIKKIYISLSEFGSLSKEHFLEHYRQKSAGTKWESVDIEIKKVPFGPELEITRMEFDREEFKRIYEIRGHK